MSLVPSVTETLTDWGIGPIACTRYCGRPDLHHVGGTKDPDVAAIIALDPDLVVLDRQENRGEDADTLKAAGLSVIALDVRSIGGLGAELAELADAVGAMHSEPPEADFTPLGLRVFVPIWRRPWMTIGGNTYGSTLLATIGVVNVFADAVDDYPRVELGEVVERRPELMLVPSEPYQFSDRHLTQLETVAPIVRVDGRDLFWWGARTPGALNRLHNRLCPR